MPLEAARQFPGALAVVRREVKPDRDGRPELASIWWRFWRPRPAMRAALTDRPRYVVATLTGKRLFFSWADPSWCPSNLVSVIARDDDYTMGVLLSRANTAWVWFRSSTMKADLRYTPSTAFNTFPWPSPTDTQRKAVAAAAAAVLQHREHLSRAEQIGLTELYNRVDDGAYTPLVALHRTLDMAVAAAYGWPGSVAQDDTELARRLGALNVQVAADPVGYAPFA